MEKEIHISELCSWLKVDAEFIRKMRRGRDGTKFPPPLLGRDGLSWFEADIVQWLTWWSERQEWVESGLDPAGLPAPEYMAAEPESKHAEQKKP